MKKIMFNDRYGLTKAVLEGRKTMTRRVVNPSILPQITEMRVLPNGLCQYKDPYIGKWYDSGKHSQPKYQVGEVVAVAQNYEDAGYARDTIQRAKFRTDNYGGWQIGDFEICLLPGWKNKMFVLSDLMPHHIRITTIRVERLQNISDEECLKEGIYKDEPRPGFCFNGYAFDLSQDQHRNILAAEWFKTPRLAFAALINRISGKGTWESNPWVFVYEFELVK